MNRVLACVSLLVLAACAGTPPPPATGTSEASAGNHGRVFLGSESSDDPAGTKKGFGDVWVATFDNPGGESGNTLNDGKRFVGSAIVETGSSAPNLGGKFNDKTALEADRTGGRCDG